MNSFGNDLKQQRILQGVRLEDIAAATRITMRHLYALEEDNFQALPGGVFNKGIVRSYAHFLNLDEDLAVKTFMEAYRSAGPRSHEDQGWEEFAENVSHQRKGKRQTNLVQWIGVGLMVVMLLLVAAGVWWWVSHYRIVPR